MAYLAEEQSLKKEGTFIPIHIEDFSIIDNALVLSNEKGEHDSFEFLSPDQDEIEYDFSLTEHSLLFPVLWDRYRYLILPFEQLPEDLRIEDLKWEVEKWVENLPELEYTCFYSEFHLFIVDLFNTLGHQLLTEGETQNTQKLKIYHYQLGKLLNQMCKAKIDYYCKVMGRFHDDDELATRSFIRDIENKINTDYKNFTRIDF